MRRERRCSQARHEVADKRDCLLWPWPSASLIARALNEALCHCPGVPTRVDYAPSRDAVATYLPRANARLGDRM